jgi:hypothetical protein
VVDNLQNHLIRAKDEKVNLQIHLQKAKDENKVLIDENKVLNDKVFEHSTLMFTKHSECDKLEGQKK